MIMEIQIRNTHLPWVKKEPITKEIDLENLFNTYWTSKAPEITVPGQSWSSVRPLIPDGEVQWSSSSGSVLAL